MSTRLELGTFGVSCASYYWTNKISAAGIRATHHLLGPEFMLDLLLYADDLESPGLEWLGMESEYNSYRLGLTKRRADWLVTAAMRRLERSQ